MRILNYLSDPLNCGSPCQKFGEVVFAVAATAIAAIAAAESQNEANKTNIDIAQKANDTQKEMMQMQQDYNNPVKQREMWEQAGYSPAAMLGHTTSSGLGSATSASVNPVFQQGSFDKMADMVYNAQKMKSEVDLNNKSAENLLEESIGKGIDNITKGQKNLNDLSLQMLNAKKLGLENTFQDLKNRFQSESFQYDLQNKNLTNQMLQVGIDKTIADTNFVAKQILIADEQYNWIGKLNQAELDYTLAKIGTESTIQQRNRAETEKLVQDALLSQAQTDNVKVDTKTAARASRHIVQLQRNAAMNEHWQYIVNKKNAQLKQLDIENYSTDKWFKRAGTVFNGVGAGAVGYGVAKGVKKPKSVQGFGVR